MATLQLFHLYLRDDTPDMAFGPCHDTTTEFLISAANEQQARVMAEKERQDDEVGIDIPNLWLNPEYTTCAPPDLGDQPEIIIRNYNRG